MHEFTLRVCYEDTDSGGIVYHADYLRFAERRAERCRGNRALSMAHFRNGTGWRLWSAA